MTASVQVEKETLQLRRWLVLCLVLVDMKGTGDDDESAVSSRCSWTAHYAGSNGLDYRLRLHNNRREERPLGVWPPPPPLLEM